MIKLCTLITIHGNAIIVNLNRFLYINKHNDDVYHIGFDFGGSDETYYAITQVESERILDVIKEKTK